MFILVAVADEFYKHFMVSYLLMTDNIAGNVLLQANSLYDVKIDFC